VVNSLIRIWVRIVKITYHILPTMVVSRGEDLVSRLSMVTHRVMYHYWVGFFFRRRAGGEGNSFSTNLFQLLSC